MKRLAAVGCALALLSTAPALARADANSSQIAGEMQRTLQEGNRRVAEFWWLPPEYWITVAKELEQYGRCLGIAFQICDCIA